MKYRVLNPRNIPTGIRIMAARYNNKEYQWFEGDEFTPPPDMADDTVAWYLARGLIEPIETPVED